MTELPQADLEPLIMFGRACALFAGADRMITKAMTSALAASRDVSAVRAWCNGWLAGVPGSLSARVSERGKRALLAEIFGSVSLPPEALTREVRDVALGAYHTETWAACRACGGQGEKFVYSRPGGYSPYGKFRYAVMESEACAFCLGGRGFRGCLDPLSLSVLADALEEAAGDDPAVRAATFHLRHAPLPCVKGCHVLRGIVGDLYSSSSEYSPPGGSLMDSRSPP